MTPGDATTTLFRISSVWRVTKSTSGSAYCSRSEHPFGDQPAFSLRAVKGQGAGTRGPKRFTSLRRKGLGIKLPVWRRCEMKNEVTGRVGR